MGNRYVLHSSPPVFSHLGGQFGNSPPQLLGLPSQKPGKLEIEPCCKYQPITTLMAIRSFMAWYVLILPYWLCQNLDNSQNTNKGKIISWSFSFGCNLKVVSCLRVRHVICVAVRVPANRLMDDDCTLDYHFDTLICWVLTLMRNHSLPPWWAPPVRLKARPPASLSSSDQSEKV